MSLGFDESNPNSQLGGWTLTPFGGRGRFRDEMIELEGIVSAQIIMASYDLTRILSLASKLPPCTVPA
jgi:hypothetical protein